MPPHTRASLPPRAPSSLPSPAPTTAALLPRPQGADAPPPADPRHRGPPLLPFCRCSHPEGRAAVICCCRSAAAATARSPPPLLATNRREAADAPDRSRQRLKWTLPRSAQGRAFASNRHIVSGANTTPPYPPTHHRMRVFVRQGRGPSCFHCSTCCTDASAQSNRYKGRYSREGAGIFMPFRLEDTYVDDIGKLDGHNEPAVVDYMEDIYKYYKAALVLIDLFFA